MKDDIKTYLIKHAEGYELDATRCKEAAAVISEKESIINTLLLEKKHLIERLSHVEAERFESSRSRRTYEA